MKIGTLRGLATFGRVMEEKEGFRAQLRVVMIHSQPLKNSRSSWGPHFGIYPVHSMGFDIGQEVNGSDVY